MFASETSWRRLQDMSSRHLQDMSSRCLEDVFSVTIFRLPRRLEDVFKDVKLLRWTRVEDVFKTSGRSTNVCWEGLILIFFNKAIPPLRYHTKDGPTSNIQTGCLVDYDLIETTCFEKNVTHMLITLVTRIYNPPECRTVWQD